MLVGNERVEEEEKYTKDEWMDGWKKSILGPMDKTGILELETNPFNLASIADHSFRLIYTMSNSLPYMNHSIVLHLYMWLTSLEKNS